MIDNIQKAENQGQNRKEETHENKNILSPVRGHAVKRQKLNCLV